MDGGKMESDPAAERLLAAVFGVYAVELSTNLWTVRQQTEGRKQSLAIVKAHSYDEAISLGWRS